MPLSLLIHENHLLIVEVLHETTAVLSYPQSPPPFSISSSLAVSTTSTVSPQTQVLNTSKSSWVLQSASSKLLSVLKFWPPPTNHKCSHWYLECEYFLEVFQFTLPRSIKGITFNGSNRLMKCISQVTKFESRNYLWIHELQKGGCASRHGTHNPIVYLSPALGW